MKILITGKGGQLAWELAQSAPSHFDVTVLGRAELDIANAAAVVHEVAELKPDVIINAAAYTGVDKAESELDQAYACNEFGPRLLAEACEGIGARLVHVSTDFVFDGTQTAPYKPADRTHPLGVYGASKLAGERAVLAQLPQAALVLRTAWVYSTHGNNFVKTMLRLMSEKPQLNVVCDQIGTPTWARGLAGCIWRAVETPGTVGVLHWTDAGVASWYDFAVAIQELALERGLLDRAIPVRPIPSSAYPTPAARPAFSVLDKSQTEAALALQTVHWRSQLAAMLDELRAL